MAEIRTHSEVGPAGRRVAANLRRLRNTRQITTGGLAEKVSAQGVPMIASTVTKIEKQSRRVTVDELAAFAAALDVLPAELLEADADPNPLTAAVQAAARVAARGNIRTASFVTEDGSVWSLEQIKPATPRADDGQG